MSKIRLSKITKKFGIGLRRLVEFLNENGVNVEMNPNAKISEENLSLIEEKFSEDMKIKLDANQIKIKLKDLIEPKIIKRESVEKTKPQSIVDITKAPVPINLDAKGEVNSTIESRKRPTRPKRSAEKRTRQDMERTEKILAISKRLIKLLFNTLHINPETLIDSNATINDTDDLSISVIFDDGQDSLISKEYLIGQISTGSRIFCRQIQKCNEIISTTIIQECSYADLMKHILHMIDGKEIDNLARLLRLICKMPIFAEYVYLMKEIHRAIKHPNNKNLDCLEEILYETQQMQYESSISNFAEFKEALDAENARYDIDNNSFIHRIRSIKKIVDEFHHLTPISNATIHQVMPSYAIADFNGRRVKFFYKHIIDKELIVRIQCNRYSQRDIVMHTYDNRTKGNVRVSTVFECCTFRKLYDMIVEYVNDGNYYYAVQTLEALIQELEIHLDYKEYNKACHILASIRDTRISSSQPYIPNMTLAIS